MFYCPLEYGVSQRNILRIQILQSQEGKDALRYVVNINGITAVMKVPNCAVSIKEMITVEVKSLSNGCSEFCNPGAAGDGPQGTQIKPGVEVINPLL